MLRVLCVATDARLHGLHSDAGLAVSLFLPCRTLLLDAPHGLILADADAADSARLIAASERTLGWVAFAVSPGAAAHLY